MRLCLDPRYILGSVLDEKHQPSRLRQDIESDMRTAFGVESRKKINDTLPTKSVNFPVSGSRCDNRRNLRKESWDKKVLNKIVASTIFRDRKGQLKS